MSDEREMLAEAVRAAVIDWNTIGTEKAAAESDVSRYITDALLASPQFARLIAAAKGEALREAADKWQWGEWANAPRRADRVAERLANANYVHTWLRNRAALTAEPAPTEGEGA